MSASRGNPEKAEEQSGEIRLGIDNEGRFFLDLTGQNGQYTGMRFISDQDLQGTLTALYAARTTDKILYLKADAHVKYARVQQAIDIARKAGVRVIGAIAEQRKVMKE